MHQSAMKRMEWFVENYIPQDQHVEILDVGSYDINGSYRSLFQNYDCNYIGLDLEEGPNVDFVPRDPYSWPELPDDSFDFIISGNAFEHIEWPWITMSQIKMKLKPGGIACILTPFCLSEHRYPTDCYRYYPDGMKALAKYAGLDVIQCTTGGLPFGLEEVSAREWLSAENYDDTMLVAIKGTDPLADYPKFVREFRSNTIHGEGFGLLTL